MNGMGRGIHDILISFCFSGICWCIHVIYISPLLCVHRCCIRRVRLVVCMTCAYVVWIRFYLAFASVCTAIQVAWRREIHVASVGIELDSGLRMLAGGFSPWRLPLSPPSSL